MSIYIIIGHFRVPKTLTFKMRPTSLVKMNLICIRMKNHFHIKGCTLNLVLIQRPGETRKLPIAKGEILSTFIKFSLLNP